MARALGFLSAYARAAWHVLNCEPDAHLIRQSLFGRVTYLGCSCGQTFWEGGR